MRERHFMPRGVFSLLMLAWLGHIGLADAAESTTYSYDALGRLTFVTKTGGRSNGVTVSYQFDAAGNRRSKNVTGTSVSATKAEVLTATAGEPFVITATVADAEIRQVSFHFGEHLLGQSVVVDGVATIEASIDQPGLALLLVRGETVNARVAELFTAAVHVAQPSR